ncbi:MAG TPA: hypothetical protein VLJ21_02190 [Candidatus Binatia bacterium]|nr:hypothetical protein [Candidatus Binatia bacterium]
MEITINTTTDSHEHIRKVIDLLKHLVGENAAVSSPPVADSSAAFAGIFGDNAPAVPTLPMDNPPTQDAPSPTAQQPQVVDIWGNPKKPDPDVGVEVY